MDMAVHRAGQNVEAIRVQGAAACKTMTDGCDLFA